MLAAILADSCPDTITYSGRPIGTPVISAQQYLKTNH